jgi:predicted methyltransferase
MKAFLFAAVALFTLAAPAYAAPAHAELAHAELADPIAAAVASPDRPAADTARDATRKPAALLAFAGIKPGDRVGDIMPGQGYFTRIFSNLVGPTGHVYAIVPAELAQRKPALVEAMNTLATTPNFHNVSPVVVPTASITAPEKLDVAWTSDNYHDVYGFFGADQAAAMDRAVFAALKPGGVFVVIDHVAHDGASATAPKTLHRIDPATVKAQVLAAGFTLEAQSDTLQNPADTHDLKVFDPAIRGRTDQFVFKFRKPR